MVGSRYDDITVFQNVPVVLLVLEITKLDYFFFELLARSFENGGNFGELLSEYCELENVASSFELSQAGEELVRVLVMFPEEQEIKPWTIDGMTGEKS
jgi:hypothetical protein